MDLTDFTTRGVRVLDLTHQNTAWRGFASGFALGKYGYFVPFSNRRPTSPKARDYSPLRNGYSGHLVRVDLTDFQTAESLALHSFDDSLRGFSSGLAVGKYAILVPFRNGLSSSDFSGNYVRVDTTRFREGRAALETTALPTYVRNQIPNIPDRELRGFSGAFASGKYAFLTPYFNGKDFGGKIVRVDVPHNDGPTEIQELDLAQTDADLCGFSGGFVAVDPVAMSQISLFGEYNSGVGTKAPYVFDY